MNVVTEEAVKYKPGSANLLSSIFAPPLKLWERKVFAGRARGQRQHHGPDGGSSDGRRPHPYHHLPYFYSDLFDLGYEASGDLNPELESVADWQEPYRKGVIYYLQEDRVRGVIMWNVWGQIEAARSVMAEPGPLCPQDLQGAIAGLAKSVHLNLTETR